MEAAWKLVRASIGALHGVIEPVIRKGMAEILKVQTSLQQKIRDAVMGRIADLFVEHVTSSIGPLLQAFEQPLKESFQSGRLLVAGSIKLSELPGDPKKRKAILDGIPRDKKTSKKLCEPLGRMSQSLNELKGANELRAKMFDGLDLLQLQSDAEMALLETIDAAVCTLEEKLETSEAQDSLLEEILQHYDNDALMAEANYVKEVLRTVLITAFKNTIAPITGPIIDQIDGAIPDAMSKFISIEQIFDDFVYSLVSQPVNQAVDSAYAQPAPA
jgi:hypothetical protein